MPAPQMMAPYPSARALRASVATFSGVRWADMTWTSTSTPNLPSISAAGAILSWSDAEPISTATLYLLTDVTLPVG